MKPGVVSVLKTVRSVVAMIVIAALALYVNEYFKKADRQGALDEAALIREQTRALQAQAAELNQRLQSANEEATALKNEVAGQRAEVAQGKVQQQVARALTEGLQLAQAARVAITESYQTTLQWPATNAEAGLPEASQLFADSLRSLRVGASGVISLVFNEKSGVSGGVIRLIPEANATGRVNWRCETASYPDIAAIVPQCRYIRPDGE